MKTIIVQTAKVVFEEMPILISEEWFEKINDITDKMDAFYRDPEINRQYRETLEEFEEEILIPQKYLINEEPGKFGEPVSVQGAYTIVDGEKKYFFDM
jgi:hypothetical protein